MQVATIPLQTPSQIPSRSSDPHHSPDVGVDLLSASALSCHPRPVLVLCRLLRAGRESCVPVVSLSGFRRMISSTLGVVIGGGLDDGKALRNSVIEAHAPGGTGLQC